jgi:hypothetical protein
MTHPLSRWLLPALAFAAAPALAHHSYAMFDMTKTVTLNGSVVQFKWQNPHSFIKLDVPVNGQVEHWAIEMTSPNNLAVEGWKRSSLKPGDKVTLQVHPLRDGAKGGSFAAVKLADGKVLGQMTSGKQSS